MSRRKKIVNQSGIPQHAIEALARCLWPDILASYEQEMNRMKETPKTIQNHETKEAT